MTPKRRKLIVIGDRVLISPDEGDERTKVGLYLPQTVIDKDSVQSGRIVATGTPNSPVSRPGAWNSQISRQVPQPRQRVTSTSATTGSRASLWRAIIWPALPAAAGASLRESLMALAPTAEAMELATSLAPMFQAM